MLQHNLSKGTAGPVGLRSTNLTVKVMMVLLLLAVFPYGSAVAQEDQWQYRFTPYLYATGLQGNTTVGETQADLDISFSDILDDLSMAFMGDFRAEKGPWAIQTDVVWTDLKINQTSGPRSLTVKPRMVFWTLDGRYRVAPSWEVLAGFRYYYTKMQLDFAGPIVDVGGSGKESWVDPIIGVGYRTAINERWSFAAEADIGGFGVGSDFAWNAQAVFDYRFGETTSVTFGYRYLDVDYETGSGRDTFGLDAYLSGPVLGVSFRF